MQYISALFYLGRGPIFSETKSISCILNESNRKYKNISMKNYHVQRMQLTLYTVELNPWNPRVCLYHTLAVHNFLEVWRVLTWRYSQNQVTASDYYMNNK